MSVIHFLNVNNGDCTIFEHANGHRTMIDICAGNIEEEYSLVKAVMKSLEASKPKGNYGMCGLPTNPVDYLRSTINANSLFRFILTHPDMDHLDGFNNLANQISISNFWDTGAKKSKPEFNNGSPYKEEDWDRYISFRNGREEGVTNITSLAGERFKYANKGEDGAGGGDGLYILAPNKQLVDDANESDDFNDCSYVILYCSSGGDVLVAGDAHDKTWEFILENYSDFIKDVKVLLAPHHGRKSSRDYSFLDVMQPDFTVFGCAPSEYLAYSAWQYRDLFYLTQNQCGNVVFRAEDGKLDVYIENEKYAKDIKHDTFQGIQGYWYLFSL